MKRAKRENPSIEAFLSNCPIWQEPKENVKVQIIISDSYESYNYTFIKGYLMVKNEIVKPKI
jgi:hypothetical protein